MGDKRSETGDKLGNKMFSAKEKVYYAILNNPQITKDEISILLGIGKTTVDNNIAALKKEGKLIRVGSNKTGHWQIVEKTE